MRPRLKSPEPQRTFVPGPPIQPAPALLAWLTEKPRGRIRLPVTVPKGQVHWNSSRAYVGIREDEPARLELHLNDTAMGIALGDHLRRVCTGDVCRVWLEGVWGCSLRTDCAEAGLPVFSVFRMVGPVTPGDTALRVQVEQQAQ